MTNEPLKFEGHYVGYMFNQAEMPFFRVFGYTKAEGDMEDFVNRAKDYYETLRKTASRVKRGMKVPKTWVKKLNEASPMVTALREEGFCCSEWGDNFFRALRFLKTYEG